MLEIREVSKTFNPGTPNELHALQAVKLTVDDGSFVIVVGTNGSGKSTLLNAVAGSFSIDSRLFGLREVIIPPLRVPRPAAESHNRDIP